MCPQFPQSNKEYGNFSLNNADCKIAMDHCLKNAFSINLKRQNNAFEAKIFLGSSSSGPKRSAAHLCLVFPFPVTSLLVAFVIMKGACYYLICFISFPISLPLKLIKTPKL